MQRYLKRVDHAFVINLDRREDRLRSFHEGCPLPEDRVERWPAVDGRTLEMTLETRALFAGNDFDSRRGVIGCALSHYSLWRHIASPSHPHHANLIFEDDAFFPDQFPALWNERIAEQLPRDFDLVYFGGIAIPNEASEAMIEKGGSFLIDPSYYVRSWVHTHLAIPSDRTFGFGTYAYLVTRPGAEALCRAVRRQGIRRAVDYFMIDQWPGLKVYTTVPFLCLSSMGSDSDVQNSESSSA